MDKNQKENIETTLDYWVSLSIYYSERDVGFLCFHYANGKVAEEGCKRYFIRC